MCRIRRKTLYYMYNIVFPCMMMSTLTVLVFCMPPDSGEKIALGVTVILAFSVFMLAIAEKMPETSESIPLIGEPRSFVELLVNTPINQHFTISGIYLTFVMAMTTISIIMTVIVLNFFYRGPILTEVPPWARRWVYTVDMNSTGHLSFVSTLCPATVNIVMQLEAIMTQMLLSNFPVLLWKNYIRTLAGNENIIYTHKILSVMGEEKGFLFPGLQEK